MNARAVSLPDLAADKRRGKPLSLSEGFTGANRNATLASTALNFAPRLTATVAPSFMGDDGTIPSRLNAVLPIYYRTRQLVLEQEKGGLRAPKQMIAELRAQEKAVSNELRPLNSLLFQRFDDTQMDRLLRAMPILKLSQGRWLFGTESLADPWPMKDGDRAFILLYGRVTLFADPQGAGDRSEIRRGAIFGEKRFRMCDETVKDIAAGAAYCEEPCIVGCLTTKLLETVFADRAFGNKRISQLVQTVPSFSRIVQPDISIEDKKSETEDKKKKEEEKKKKEEAQEASNAILTALRDLAKIATTIHVRPGQEVQMEDPLDENLLIVAKGCLEVRGDVHLVEKLEALPPKKVRINIEIDRAEKLAGDSIWDKLDPFCVVQMGEFKRLQTRVLWNVGPNPKFEYEGQLTYNGETEIVFKVFDHDLYSADDLCGEGTLRLDEIPDVWSGKVELTEEKKTLLGTSSGGMEQPAGKLFVKISYDYEKVNEFTKKPAERSWQNMELFTVKERGVWGHEQLMLGSLFKRTIESASNQLKYRLQLGGMKVVAASPRGEQETTICWKVTKKRFHDFIKHCGREKQFIQACRVSALEKQSQTKDLLNRLIRRWEQEEQATWVRSADFMKPKQMEESYEPSRFKVDYKGVKCHIIVRYALNLAGGSWWDKLDPYAIVRFRNGKQKHQTSVLQDAGSDPQWDVPGGGSKGTITYNGEELMEIEVWDYDKYSQDDKVAVGHLGIEKFGQTNGYEGQVPLSLPGNKKRRNLKQMFIVIGVQWDPPRDPNATQSTAMTGTQRLMNSTM